MVPDRQKLTNSSASGPGQLIALGREVKWALNTTEHAAHPTDPRLSGVYGTILHEDLGGDGGQVRQRNITVFADGEVDARPADQGPARGWPSSPIRGG
jgi:proline racemase